MQREIIIFQYNANFFEIVKIFESSAWLLMIVHKDLKAFS